VVDPQRAGADGISRSGGQPQREPDQPTGVVHRTAVADPHRLVGLVPGATLGVVDADEPAGRVVQTVGGEPLGALRLQAGLADQQHQERHQVRGGEEQPAVQPSNPTQALDRLAWPVGVGEGRAVGNVPQEVLLPSPPSELRVVAELGEPLTVQDPVLDGPDIIEGGLPDRLEHRRGVGVQRRAAASSGFACGVLDPGLGLGGERLRPGLVHGPKHPGDQLEDGVGLSAVAAVLVHQRLLEGIEMVGFQVGEFDVLGLPLLNRAHEHHKAPHRRDQPLERLHRAQRPALTRALPQRLGQGPHQPGTGQVGQVDGKLPSVEAHAEHHRADRRHRRWRRGSCS